MIFISAKVPRLYMHYFIGLLCLPLLTECENVRLVGPSRCSGRVEVNHDGRWGTVCDDRWSMINGDVLCRQLNCGTVVEAKSKASFGKGRDPIWLDDVECTGNETSILDCKHRPFGANNCGHSEDVGVVCSEHVRLVNGSNWCSGRLQVYQNGHWKRVCGSDWGKEEAEVICREINCGLPLMDYKMQTFGEAGATVKFNCSGNETSISECTRQEVSETCADATVECANSKLVRLVNGTNQCSGRVEVYYDGQWGTVCDDRWGMEEAVVACREMNCGNPLSVKYRSFFGTGQDNIWMDDVECTGHEKSLTQCAHRGFGTHDCDHQEDAGLICSETLRLSNGHDRCSGSLDLFHNGHWGKMCNDGWGVKEATILCKELGCGVPKTSSEEIDFGDGSGLRSYISTCSGNVSSINQCAIQVNQGSCKAVSVSCTGATQMRLVNGTDRCSGRVEILQDSQWGTVCDDKWDITDAQVVCRALDCGTAHRSTARAFFGEGEGPIFLDDVECQGNETSLFHCRHRSFSENNCVHGEDAGVVCSPTIRLINGTDQCSGRVEFHLLGQWVSAYNDRWGMNEAAVVCRETNCGDPVKSSESFGQGGQLRGYKVTCNGTESSLTRCTLREHVRTSQDHIEEASVVCSGNLRLADGHNRCVGRVEVFDRGQWGTVCGETWNIKAASVVCRKLNCDSPHKITNKAEYGRGLGPTLIDELECVGDEATLYHCTQREFTNITCKATSFAGVACTGGLVVRLANGKDQCSGRVEVLQGETWQTVCDADWTLSKADVVCKLLGCERAVNSPVGAYFGQGNGSSVEATDSCFSNITSVEQCSVKGFKTATCGHERDAGAVCAGPRKLRLVNGTNQCSGRVEILHNGQWGTVCDDDWDLKDAQVVCRENDCGTAKKIHSGAFFGEGQGPIWLDDVRCTGDEPSLWQCRHRGIGENNCGHSEDAGVECSRIFRFTNGTDNCSGSLEIFYDGQWGKICDNNWSLREAKMACSELGCGIPAKYGIYNLGASSALTSYTMACSDHVSSITQCQTQVNQGTCQAVTVSCAGISTLRLVNGTDRCSGRVEVLHRDQWGTVCDDHWDIREAQVVCRAMDCGLAQTSTTTASFGKGQGPIWMDDVDCSGDEISLLKCRHRPFGSNNCGHGEDVGVVCLANIRLLNGTDQCSGRVELYHQNEWSPAHNADWGMNEATVVCKEMNCGVPIKVLGSFGQSRRLSGYKVSCNGSESSLTQCTLKEHVRTSQDRIEEASVECSGDVRLADGHNRCVGRVEFFNKGQWGNVAGEQWDIDDAKVVCKQLNCGKPHVVTTMAEYGYGTGLFWIEHISCNGFEPRVDRCRKDTYPDPTSNITSVAGVSCTGSIVVRLADGKDQCSGRVEVLNGGTWQTVCDAAWTLSKADVVCRLLGCEGAVGSPGNAHFGRGNGLVAEATDSCFSNATSLQHCSFRGFRAASCGHERDAGVVCADKPALRLVNGNNRCSGRVEVLHNDQWGTVCDDEWDLNDAHVVCRAMGCGSAQRPKHESFFGEGSGPIWLDDVNCSGNETSLLQCGRLEFGDNNCGHSEDAGVECSVTIRLINGTDRCSGRVEFYHDGKWAQAYDVNWGMNEAMVVCRETNCGDTLKLEEAFSRGAQLKGYKVSCNGTESSLTECTVAEYTSPSQDRVKQASVVCSGSVKLADGHSRCDGRVEIFQNSQWWTVCDNSVDQNSANVLCRELNCGKAHRISTGSEYGRGLAPIWNSGLHCNGPESTVVQCLRESVNRTCNSTSVASVFCIGSLEVQLVGGSDQCSGRVEVRHGTTWQTVCDKDWTTSKAEVVCKLLECGRASNGTVGTRFGPGSGRVAEASDSCFSSVASLQQCSSNGFKTASCGHERDVGAVCEVRIQLVNGSNECSGRVEVLYKGQWGTVCDDRWGMDNANVVCRQLGCGHAIAAPTNAHYGRGSGPIWLDNVECGGEESILTHCSHPGFGENDCGHDEDAGVTCAGALQKPEISVSPGLEVNWGDRVEITCTVVKEHLGGTFILKNSQGTFRKEKFSEHEAMTFSFSKVDLNQSGSYFCEYRMKLSDQIIDFPQGNPVNLSVTVKLEKPFIHIASRYAMVIYSPDRISVSRGNSFSLNCSIYSMYSNGFFYLTKSGVNFTEAKPAFGLVISQANFEFPTMDYGDQGEYRCIYGVNVSSMTVRSVPSTSLVVTVVSSSSRAGPGVAVSLLLLTIILLVVGYVVWRRRGGNFGFTFPFRNTFRGEIRYDVDDRCNAAFDGSSNNTHENERDNFADGAPEDLAGRMSYELEPLVFL